MRITARLDSGVLKWQQRPIRPNRRASRYPRAPARRWSSARRCWSPRSRFALRRSRSRPLARSAPRPAAIRPGWDPSPGPRVSEGRPMRRPPRRCHRQGRTSMTLRRGRVWASPPRAPIAPAAIPPRRRPRSGLHTPGRRPRPPTWAGRVSMGDAVLQGETGQVSGLPVLVAGPWARSETPIVNPSYFSPRAYADLASAHHDSRWDDLEGTSRSIGTALTGAGLPPDWARLDAPAFPSGGEPACPG